MDFWGFLWGVVFGFPLGMWFSFCAMYALGKKIEGSGKSADDYVKEKIEELKKRGG